MFEKKWKKHCNIITFQVTKSYFRHIKYHFPNHFPYYFRAISRKIVYGHARNILRKGSLFIRKTRESAFSYMFTKTYTKNVSTVVRNKRSIMYQRT